MTVLRPVQKNCIHKECIIAGGRLQKQGFYSALMVKEQGWVFIVTRLLEHGVSTFIMSSMFNRENYLPVVNNTGQSKGITKLSITAHQWNTTRYCLYVTELYDWLILLWFTPYRQYSSHVTSATMKNDRLWSFEVSLAAIANLLFFEIHARFFACQGVGMTRGTI